MELHLLGDDGYSAAVKTAQTNATILFVKPS